MLQAPLVKDDFKVSILLTDMNSALRLGVGYHLRVFKEYFWFWGSPRDHIRGCKSGTCLFSYIASCPSTQNIFSTTFYRGCTVKMLHLKTFFFLVILPCRIFVVVVKKKKVVFNYHSAKKMTVSELVPVPRAKKVENHWFSSVLSGCIL